MVIGFKKEFKPLILAGSKIHTIRADKGNRYAVGKKLHMYTGVRTKGSTLITDQFTITAIEDISFQNRQGYVGGIKVGSLLITKDVQLEELAKNDGFDDVSKFLGFFNDEIAQLREGEWFNMKLIHWTNFRYAKGDTNQ